MSNDADNSDDGLGFSREDLRVDKLRDIAHSADLETDGKKETLVGRLRAKGISFGPDGWTDEDGEPFEVKPRPTGSAPSDTTILYAFERDKTPEDFVGDLEELAGDHGYELRREQTEGTGKVTLKVIEPAEGHD